MASELLGLELCHIVEASLQMNSIPQVLFYTISSTL